jgi:FlaA1/EpsC-like NDP-sugar epimerase
MENNPFFIPSPLYKEFMLLDVIEKNPSITQRSMSQALNVAVSMINSYLSEYEEKGFLIRRYLSPKVVEYEITPEGKERRKLLNIWYLQATHAFFEIAKSNIVIFLNQIINRGFIKLLFYGAGEVAEIILHTIESDSSFPIEVVAIVDDNPIKIGSSLLLKKVIRKEEIFEYNHDAILIASYHHHTKIYDKLIDLKYNQKNIIHFFD